MASGKFTVQQLEQIFPVHPSVTNGFMCANCGEYMNPPYILYCGHSVCSKCLEGKPSANGLMNEISCRPCGKTVVRTSFLKPAENEALKVAVWRAHWYRAEKEIEINELHHRVKQLEAAMSTCEADRRRLAAVNHALQSEVVARRCMVPPPPMPPTRPAVAGPIDWMFARYKGKAAAVSDVPPPPAPPPTPECHQPGSLF